MKKRPSVFFTWLLIFTGMALATVSFTSSSSTDQGSSPKEVVVDFRNVAKKAVPAIVSIRVQTKKGSSLWEGTPFEDPSDLWEFFNLPRRDSRQQEQFVGQASGVIVSADGYILTNNHVVKEMDKITVQLTDGREFTAKVLGQDPNSDLALIKIDAKDLPYLTLGDSSKLEVGQWVAAIGNPFGLQATLTVGVVSAKGRNNLDIVPYEDFIQTDAAINRGNSGGALLDTNGDVIGINTAIATNSSASYMGIGFAIPSNMAKYVIDQIRANGKVSRGFLGVTLQSIDYNLAQAFDLKKIEGALITSVAKDSPAEKAGIKAEDIVVKFDNTSVENAATLRNGIYMIKPGTKVVLTILRQGQSMEVPLVVGEFAESSEKPSAAPQADSLGLEVDTLTPELARAAGNADAKGVIITRVQPGSPASFSGLKKGLLILGVNRQKVETKEQFYAAVKETPKGRPVLLQLKQGNSNLFVSIQVE